MALDEPLRITTFSDFSIDTGAISVQSVEYNAFTSDTRLPMYYS